MHVMETYECDTCGTYQTVDPREFVGTPDTEAILAANYEWRIVVPRGWANAHQEYSTRPAEYNKGRHLCSMCKKIG